MNVLITGAAGSIGEATARLMSGPGRQLFLLDRDGTKVEALAGGLERAVPIVADATDPAALEAAFQCAAVNGLDAVVLAAGGEGPVGPLEDCADSDFDALMTLNVRSVWLGLKHSLRIMKPQKRGSVVALASISGVVGAPMLAPYAASKHAVMGLVRTAARETAAYNVRVNAVCPAPVDSEMMKRIDGALSERFPERLAGRPDASKSMPMQRYAEPAEVAQAIAFLCSDAASYCSGTAFMVDGGLTCR